MRVTVFPTEYFDLGITRKHTFQRFFSFLCRDTDTRRMEFLDLLKEKLDIKATCQRFDLEFFREMADDL